MNRKVEYGIEFAHIYDNQLKIGNEQLESIKKTKRLIQSLDRKGLTYSLCVMIDEYNPRRHVLDIDQYLHDLRKKGTPPSYISYESKMIYEAANVLKSIPKNQKTRKEIIQDNKLVKHLQLKGEGNNKISLKKHKQFSCPLLIAIWNLHRLGALIYKDDAISFTGLTEKKPFVAKKIINVLPQKYMKVELYALEILKSSKFKSYVDNIEHVYF